MKLTEHQTYLTQDGALVASAGPWNEYKGGTSTGKILGASITVYNADFDRFTVKIPNTSPITAEELDAIRSQGLVLLAKFDGFVSGRPYEDGRTTIYTAKAKSVSFFKAKVEVLK